MYPNTTPGSDASFITDHVIWKDIFEMLSQWRNGDFSKTTSARRSGTIQILNNTGRDVEAGEMLQISGMTQPADSSLGIGTNYSPIMSAVEPVWHTAIDNIILADGPVPQDQYFSYHPRRFGIVSCSGGFGGPQRYIMPDPANPKFGFRSSSGIFRILGYDATNEFAIVDLHREQTLWRCEYLENSQAPSSTTAKLLSIGDQEFSDDVEIEDPDSVADDAVTGYKSYCIQIGNEFHIQTGPCS